MTIISLSNQKIYLVYCHISCHNLYNLIIILSKKIPGDKLCVCVAALQPRKEVLGVHWVDLRNHTFIIYITLYNIFIFVCWTCKYKYVPDQGCQILCRYKDQYKYEPDLGCQIVLQPLLPCFLQRPPVWWWWQLIWFKS